AASRASGSRFRTTRPRGVADGHKRFASTGNRSLLPRRAFVRWPAIDDRSGGGSGARGRAVASFLPPASAAQAGGIATLALPFRSHQVVVHSWVTSPVR